MAFVQFDELTYAQTNGLGPFVGTWFNSTELFFNTATIW